MSERLAEAQLRRSVFARLKSSVLCSRDVPLTNAWDVIGWWESRRVSFNLIVGSAGVFSCIVVGVVAMEPRFCSTATLFGLPDPPGFALVGILLYGIMANICFTGGWLSELFVRRLWPREAHRFATLSFSLGLIFSVLLTLTPAIVIGAGGILAS